VALKKRKGLTTGYAASNPSDSKIKVVRGKGTGPKGK